MHRWFNLIAMTGWAPSLFAIFDVGIFEPLGKVSAAFALPFIKFYVSLLLLLQLELCVNEDEKKISLFRNPISRLLPAIVASWVVKSAAPRLSLFACIIESRVCWKTGWDVQFVSNESAKMSLKKLNFFGVVEPRKQSRKQTGHGWRTNWNMRSSFWRPVRARAGRTWKIMFCGKFHNAIAKELTNLIFMKQNKKEENAWI